MDIRWIASMLAVAVTVLAGAGFFGLAVLGSEWRLRNEEWSPDEPDWGEQ